jgi:cbb3-type cytochrome oxidase subunit 3
MPFRKAARGPDMLYFWLIPAVLLFVLLIWFLYGAATKRRAAGVRTSGETLVDKTEDEPAGEGLSGTDKTDR